MVYGRMDNVVLIGFMGCGKTSLGMKLANAYGFQFLDTDAYIEEKEGIKINDIFCQKGETYFRDLEYRCLEEIRNTVHHCVISTGGGMPLCERNVKLLQSIGSVIFLKTSKETTYVRLKGDTKRPLLQCDNPEQRIEELLRIRVPIYEKAANYIIDTDQKSFYALIEEISKSILMKSEE